MPNYAHRCRTSTLIIVPINFWRNSDPFKKRTFFKLKILPSKSIFCKSLKFSTQKYLLSPIFSNEDVNQLYALRSGTTNCKVNFKNKYINGDLLCDLCGKENQDQQHLLKCEVLLRKLKSKQMLNNCPEYENIYSRDVIKQ